MKDKDTTGPADGKPVEITAKVSDETVRKLEAFAKERGISVECLIAELLERELHG